MFIGSIEVRPDAGAVRYDIPTSLAATVMAQRLVAWVLPEWLGQFLAKNRKYAEVEQDLGAAGVIPDINRKVGVLKDRLWFGTEVVGEPTTEVIDDLIGHLFILRHMVLEDETLDGTAVEHGPRVVREANPAAVRTESEADRMARELYNPPYQHVKPRPVRDNPQA